MPAPLALLVLEAHELEQYDDILAFHPIFAPVPCPRTEDSQPQGWPCCQTIFPRSERKVAQFYVISITYQSKINASREFGIRHARQMSGRLGYWTILPPRCPYLDGSRRRKFVPSYP